MVIFNDLIFSGNAFKSIKEHKVVGHILSYIWDFKDDTQANPQKSANAPKDEDFGDKNFPYVILVSFTVINHTILGEPHYLWVGGGK